MDSYIALMLFGSFFILVFIGVPISFSIGIATVGSMLLMFPWDIAVITVSQRTANGLDNFALLAIPFFIFAGTLMNSGGIAIRLINLAQVMVGRVPGSLGHVNVLANMMFGSISGSAVAAAAAVGGTLNPIQTQKSYDPAFSTAVNVSSCITGLLIPPSNVLIVFSLTAGGVSVASLFMAGYLPGILMERLLWWSVPSLLNVAAIRFLNAPPAPRRQKRFRRPAQPAAGDYCDGQDPRRHFYRYRSVGYRRGLHLYPVGAHLSGSEMARSAEADP
jgi:tripartite ATP-independent transporter DctM subunit